MANQPEISQFDPGVYQIELTDPILAGPGGVVNAPLLNLANRTRFLKDRVDAVEASLPVNYPLVRPSLNLDFVNSKSLDPRITFSRASIGTYVGSDGFVKVATLDEPRFDRDPITKVCRGLLIEESRTNSFINSDQGTAINGTLSAVMSGGPFVSFQTFTPNNASSGNIGVVREYSAQNPTIDQACSVAVETTAPYIYVATNNAGTQSNVGIVWRISTADLSVVQLRSANATSYGLTVKRFNGNWFRIEAAFVHGSNSGSKNFGLLCTSELKDVSDFGAANTIYLNIFNNALVQEIKVGAWQYEKGRFATSYIPTTTAAVTRVEDFARFTNLSPFYRSDEGTLFSEAVFFGLSGASQGWMSSFCDGSQSNNFFGLNHHATLGSIRGVVTDTNGSTQASLIQSGSALGLTKAALAAKSNDFALSVNGASATTDISGVMPRPTILGIGNGGRTVSTGCGHIRRVAYYPARLTNAQLQAITAL